MKLNHEHCNLHLQSLDIHTKRILVCIAMEMMAAKKKHPDWPKEIIDGTAIITEEVGEVVKAALQHKYEGGRYFDIHREAIQAGAMVVRFLYNLPEKPLPGEVKDTTPLYQKTIG